MALLSRCFLRYISLPLTRNWRNSTKFPTLSLAYAPGSGCYFESSLWPWNDSPCHPNKIAVSTIGAIAALTSSFFDGVIWTFSSTFFSYQKSASSLQYNLPLLFYVTLLMHHDLSNTYKNIFLLSMLPKTKFLWWCYHVLLHHQTEYKPYKNPHHYLENKLTN